MTDEDLMWKRRFGLFALARVAGLALFLIGVAICFTDLLRPGGWPLLGGVLAITGAIEAVVTPRILKRSWDRR